MWLTVSDTLLPSKNLFMKIATNWGATLRQEGLTESLGGLLPPGLIVSFSLDE